MPLLENNFLCTSSVYLALVGEFGRGYVQLLVLFLEFGELGLQTGLLQAGRVQLTLKSLMIRLQKLIVLQELLVCRIQPAHMTYAHEQSASPERDVPSS